jgi:hypothetical protein
MLNYVAGIVQAGSRSGFVTMRAGNVFTSVPGVRPNEKRVAPLGCRRMLTLGDKEPSDAPKIHIGKHSRVMGLCGKDVC